MKNQTILKLIFFSFVFIFMSHTYTSHAENRNTIAIPTVQIERYSANRDPQEIIPPPTQQELQCAATNDPSRCPGPIYSPGKYPRLLGYSEAKIREYILNEGVFPGDEQNYAWNEVDYSFKTIQQGNLRYLLVKFSGFTTYSHKTAYRPMAVYLLKHNQSIGYVLMDYLSINAKQPFPALTQILQGRKNESFSHKINHQGHKLRKEARQTKKTEFEFVVFDIHAKHSDYIEQYGLVVDAKAKDYLKKLPYEICLDAFYPEKYEKEMEELILQWLPTLAYTFGD